MNAYRSVVWSKILSLDNLQSDEIKKSPVKRITEYVYVYFTPCSNFVNNDYLYLIGIIRVVIKHTSTENQLSCKLNYP